MVEFTYFVYIVVYSVGQTFGDAGTNFLSRILVGESYSVLLLVGVAASCFWLGRATGYYRTALPFDSHLHHINRGFPQNPHKVWIPRQYFIQYCVHAREALVGASFRAFANLFCDPVFYRFRFDSKQIQAVQRQG